MAAFPASPDEGAAGVLISDACEMVCRSDAGCVRTLNEDVATVRPDIGLLLVADGMGGHNAGELAARIAAEAVEEKLRHGLVRRPVDAAAAGELLRQAVVRAGRRIRRKAAAERHQSGMGATLACVLLYDDHACVVHVGDTRVYRLRDRRLQLLTRDHSPNQQAHDAGLISAEQLAASHNRHLVTQALGLGGEGVVRSQLVPVVPGDIFLVCSDGLNDMVDGQDIELVLDSFAEKLPMAADQLVMIARDCGGHDNVSVALARVDMSFAQGGRSLLARLLAWLPLRGDR